MFGLVLLDKPPGLTSRAAVNRVQKLVKPEKVGHAGTLDPIATGLLVVCLGRATRLVPHLHAFSKTYVAEFLLGCTSVSDDVESEVVPLAAPPRLTDADIERALPAFRGRIQQVPPLHSAVHVQGRRAYKMARRGAEIELPAREVEIQRLELKAFAPDRITLEMDCSSGTYVRSLGRDLARSLGTGGVMSALRRTRIGPFLVGDSINPELITPDSLTAALLPPRCVVSDRPSYTADDREVAQLQVGRAIRPRSELPTGVEIAVCDEGGVLIALAEQLPDGTLPPRLVFHARH